MSDSMIIILVFASAAWIWWDSRGSAEFATRMVRQYCQSAGVSFLNDTVSWQKMRLKRNKLGRMQIERTYFFEFTSDVQRRYQGKITILGRQVQSINLGVHRIW